MKRIFLLTVAGIALCSSLVVAQDAPESLLPPGFDSATAPTPSRPQPASPAPRASATPGSAGGGAVVQPVPSQSASAPAAPLILPENLPSIAEIEAMTTDEGDELLGLKPKFDIPPAARRSLDRVGVLAVTESGMPPRSLEKQPASLVRAALAGTRGPLVSRWGHIMLRRALSSRLAPPAGMNPVEFAALRVALLNRMGEPVVARAIAQSVDSAEYSPALTDAAFDAYLATSDIIGVCPVARLKRDMRKDAQWELARSICAAFAGEANSAKRELDKALSRGIAPRIDVLLAQRVAGAAGDGRGAVTIEWDGVKELTPWRFALANALGLDIPGSLLSGAGNYYRQSAALAPMLPLAQRAQGADLAAGRGILSASAMVDLYSQIYADGEVGGAEGANASLLREAYVAGSVDDRLDALRTLWGADSPDYGRQVLTAFAAARIPPGEDAAADAPTLIAAMLSAGLDRNALRWGKFVDEGSEGWAQLVLAQPRRNGPISAGALDSFLDADGSEEQRKSRFFVAGLAGLGRIDKGELNQASDRLGIDLSRQTRWTRMIDLAARHKNQPLVAMLAGLGMQGSSWDKMTARHLYHIVSALNRVGLEAEARMIAAEAVARG